MSYATMKDVQKQIHCFMLEDPPQPSKQTMRDSFRTRPSTPVSALYQVNADPTNPLHCRPQPTTDRVSKN